MAHKTGSGSTKNNRDSQPKKLGVKVNMYQIVNKGTILVRQRGFKYKAGNFVTHGKDYTLYSATKGIVIFSSNIVNIIPTLKANI